MNAKAKFHKIGLTVLAVLMLAAALFVTFSQAGQNHFGSNSPSHVGQAPLLESEAEEKQKPSSQIHAGKNQALLQNPAFNELEFSRESLRMNRLGHDSKATEVRLRNLAKTFSPADIEVLESKVLNSQDENDRMLALYLLGLSEMTPASVFVRVASMPISVDGMPPAVHSQEESRQRFQSVLAMIALKNLQNLVVNKRASPNDFNSVVESTQDPHIARLAAKAQRSLLSGRVLPMEASL